MSLTRKDRKDRSASGKEIPDDDALRREFSSAIAAALEKDFGGVRGAVKTVARLTGANQRAVKNWFEARNAPSGKHLVILARHSDEVLDTFLLLAGRSELLRANHLRLAKDKIEEMVRLIRDP